MADVQEKFLAGVSCFHATRATVQYRSVIEDDRAKFSAGLFISVNGADRVY
jgi:hypothetical protein